jgi:hypothetical protein
MTRPLGFVARLYTSITTGSGSPIADGFNPHPFRSARLHPTQRGSASLNGRECWTDAFASSSAET